MELRLRLRELKRACTSSSLLALLLGGFCHGQITLEADYADSASARKPMRYHWDIFNRISPASGLEIPGDRRSGICLVRPLGGIASAGEKVLAEDTYKWDGKQHVYDWAPLKRKIDIVMARERLHQLMIDNVPWAFQAGVDRKGYPEVDTYGNAWPPNDPKAWSDYIQAMVAELIRTYGRQEVMRWRFCIGREIGTGGHWRAGRDAFFAHYRNTRAALLAALPEAKVGAHFLWASSSNSYGPAFVAWCKANGIGYDFIGVSYYPFYNQENRVNLDRVYRNDFAPILEHPDWRPAATLEIHEFALIKSLDSDGAGFTKAEGKYQEAFTVLLTKMLNEHGIGDVFQWGADVDSPSRRALSDLAGHVYQTSSRRGAPRLAGSQVDALFGRDPATGNYAALASNYHAYPGAVVAESLILAARLPVPAGTLVKYRSAAYAPASPDAPWSEWSWSRTEADEGSPGSRFKFQSSLPPFTFLRVEWIADAKNSGVQIPVPDPASRQMVTQSGSSAWGRKIIFRESLGPRSRFVDVTGRRINCFMQNTLSVPGP